MGPNDDQWSAILDEVQDDVEMRTGQFTDGCNGKVRVGRKWDAAAAKLNKLGPPSKNGKQWKDAFYGLRSRARQAYADQVSYMRGTGGGESPEVRDVIPNPIYARCLEICGTVTAVGNKGVLSSLQSQRRVSQASDSDSGSSYPHHSNYSAASDGSANARQYQTPSQFSGGFKDIHTPPHTMGISPARKRLNYTASQDVKETFKKLDLNNSNKPGPQQQDSNILLEHLQIMQVTLSDILESNNNLTCTLRELHGAVTSNTCALEALHTFHTTDSRSTQALEAMQELQSAVNGNSEALEVLEEGLHGLEAAISQNTQAVGASQDQFIQLIKAVQNLKVEGPPPHPATVAAANIECSTTPASGTNKGNILITETVEATDEQGSAIRYIVPP